MEDGFKEREAKTLFQPTVGDLWGCVKPVYKVNKDYFEL